MMWITELKGLIEKWNARSEQVAPDKNFAGSSEEKAERETEADVLSQCASQLENLIAKEASE